MDGDAPEPVEVELTSHEPRPERGRRRRAPSPARRPEPGPTDLVPTASTGGPVAIDHDRPGSGQDGRPSERSRLLATAAVVGVVALAIGLLVGRSTNGGDGDTVAEATATTSTTVADPEETLPIVGEEIGGADFDPSEPESTQVPIGTTTTTVPAGPTTEPVEVDPRLAGVPVRLVGIELGGVLVEVDLATSTLTDFRAARIAADGSPIVVGDDWVIVSSNGRSRIVRSDGSSEPIDVGDPWQVLHVPGTDLIWRTPGPTAAPADELVLRLIGLDGEPVGPEMVLPALSWPVLADPVTGGVVVTNLPRNYIVTPDDVAYLGTGALIAIGRDVVITWDCDEELVCSLYRTDRATGERSAVPVSGIEPPYRLDSLLGWGGTSQRTAVSPDGRWAPVAASSWNTSALGIVELDTGRFVELARDTYPPSIAWSPDGRFAFTLVSSEVFAYDTLTDERFPVFESSVQWTELGSRPASSADGVAGPDAAADGPTLLSATPEEPIEG